MRPQALVSYAAIDALHYVQVATQQALPALKQTLKLYTSISLPKLAALMEQDQSAVRSQLLILKVTWLCLVGQAMEGLCLHVALGIAALSSSSSGQLGFALAGKRWRVHTFRFYCKNLLSAPHFKVACICFVKQAMEGLHLQAVLQIAALSSASSR